MVCDGDTVKDPLAETGPIPGSMLTVSASVEDQVRVAGAPWIAVEDSRSSLQWERAL